MSDTSSHSTRGGVPLALKTLLFTLLIGTSVWLVMDWLQREELRLTFFDELAAELEEQSREDRRLFDRRVQWVRHASRLIGAQRRFLDYVEGWSSAADGGAPGEMVVHHRPPPWLPASSVLRSFFNASHALLIDPRGRVREVYHHAHHLGEGREISPVLLEPSPLLRKLSHNQSYLTTVEGRPYILAAHTVNGPNGRPLATLLLAAAVDHDFLVDAVGLEGRHVMALLDGRGRRVVASSSEAIPPGTLLAEVEGRYLMMGKSFFDYGASDLELQFAAFVPTAQAERMANRILGKNNRQRALLAVALVLASGLFAMYSARRIRHLSEVVTAFSERLFGHRTEGGGGGDEIARLDRQFRELSEEILQAKDRLQREAEQRVELTLKAMAGEQRALELSSLKSVTEALAVGIIFDDGQEVRPFNTLMARFARECGGVMPFLPDEGQSHSQSREPAPEEAVESEVLLSDHDGNLRIFTIRPHPALGAMGALVRDITAQRMAERELNVVANFPAKNPNPVLRVDRRGRLLYANEACEQLLISLGIEIGELIPAEWRRELETLLEQGMGDPLEMAVGGRDYAFVPAFVDGADFLYLYGQEVTARRQVEREQQLAAAITENVLDGIVVTDVRGVIQTVNPAFTEITGYGADEVTGRTTAILKSDRHDREFFREMWRRLNERGQWVGEVWNRRKDGSIFPAILRISAIRDDKGASVAFASVLSDISERKQQEERLTRMAYHDALTRLPNRILLLDRMSQAIALAGREGGRLALLFLDLDGFKGVNDTLGHATGDLLLQGAADRLLGCVRESDTVSRLGGDEFAILLQEVNGGHDAQRVADKVLEVLREPFELKGERARVSGSIGIALYPDDGLDARLLLKHADEAMYRAKHAGKNRYAFHGVERGREQAV